MHRFLKYQLQPVDNTSLVLFRWAFGSLIFMECIGAIILGWVKKTLVDPTFTFTFIGFEWLQPLPGYGMYFYYGIMGLLGLLIMLGVYYRYSLGLFTIMWWATYLMQKSSYNNHYYLLILLCILMLLVPAHQYASYDARKDPSLASTHCPRWCIDIFKWQLLIVYTYAGLAKLSPGWLHGDFISMAFSFKSHWPLIGDLLQTSWLQKLVVLGGVTFDLTIIPLLLIPRTRWLGVFASILFHLFNSVVFGIGIFPYLMISSLLLFFSMDKYRHKLPWSSEPVDHSIEGTSPLLGAFLGVYFLFQLILPLRHHWFEGEVIKTEEGHRMSWRMMLRFKSGVIQFKMVDKNTGQSWYIHPSQYLTAKQTFALTSHPDMIWQFARYLAKDYARQGITDLEIYALSEISINGGAMELLIDPDVDLLGVPWQRFRHNPWILTRDH